jgi:hypothetical protein
MKYFLYQIALLLSLSIFISSCEDPIDLDLGNPVSQVVIDAVINQTTDTQWIYVSKSVAYLNNGQPQGYQVDSVGILDTFNFVFHKFQMKESGKYFFVPPSANTFQFGKTYQLAVFDKQNTYVSESKLNAPTTIDSLTVKYEKNGPFGGSEGNYITLWSKDKVGVGDYYWFKLYRNDSLQSKASDIRIAIDNSTTQGGNGDGDLFIIPIRQNFSSRPYLKGETARIEILSITPEMFLYLSLITTQLENVGLFAVPPSNVPTNIVCINNPQIKPIGFFCMTGKVSTDKLVIP